MKILNARGDPDLFFARLKASGRRLLLLDYDGTLAPFRVKRDQAFPYPEVPQLLDSIASRSRTRIVIISGRRTRDLLPLLGMRHRPELWGSHGWERLRADGGYEVGEIPDPVTRILSRASAWAHDHGLERQLERKPASVALHWRGKEFETETRLRSDGEQFLRKLGQQANLDLQEFDGGLELRFPGCDKGTAVRRILAEESAEAAIAYLGDDRTDEDAFTALQGRGLNVLVRREWRPTVADLWLEPPAELLNFLRRWQGNVNEGPGPREES